ncbi:MAG: hypothetical protein HOP19_11055 [Acidobacteria bacterium]|nr:hypothetical protein [Acidobacteriota bacterium]
MANAQCQPIIRGAVVSAIQLANNAASMLETGHPEAARLFQFFFGHAPSRPVPWAGNRASGAIVAIRFRAVARALQSRGTLFRCNPACTVNASTCAGSECSPREPNVVELCQGFWNPPAGLHLAPQFFRGAVILHEMLHLLFTDFFHHPGHSSGDPVRRRDNAHCYEAFALRAAGHAADHVDVTACRTRPV